jgi:hypothetical protein
MNRSQIAAVDVRAAKDRHNPERDAGKLGGCMHLHDVGFSDSSQFPVRYTTPSAKRDGNSI